MDKTVLQNLGQKIYEEWLEANKATSFEELIKEQVHELLDGAKTEILGAVMGLRTSYGGRWEFDYTNNRQSILGAEVRKVAQEVAEAWIKEELPNIKISQAQKLAIRKEVTKKVKDNLHYRMREQFDALISEEIKQAASDAVSDFKAMVHIEHGDKL